MTSPSPTPTSRRRLSGHGLSVDLAAPWEGRIYLRPTSTAAYTSPQARASAGVPGGALGWAGETQSPVLHLANFALPGGRGDFGTGAVERMTASHAFIALLEFGQAEAGSALFASEGLPEPTPEEFDPNGLQKRLAGQAGYQRFFTLNGRPMCLYVVVGAASRLRSTIPEVNRTLTSISVEPA